MAGYQSETQKKNIGWFLPRPKPDHYKGGMPLYAEEWLIQLGCDILNGHPETWSIARMKMNLLNLFCGMNKYGFRVDIKEEVKPDLVADAHNFADKIKQQFTIILADPPYSTDEAKELYGTPKLNYKKWTNECDKVLKDGGLLIVYHKYIMPNPNPDKYEVVKRVFIGNRTYHLPRVATYFKKNLINNLKN